MLMWEALANLVSDTALAQWIQATYWLWPVLEILHFIGLSLLFGGLLIVDLRMLGFFTQINQLATHKLLPLVIGGFALNLITGVLFFFGDPMRYSINIALKVKMSLVVLAGLNALFYHFKVEPLGREKNDFSLEKISAAVSLIAWTGVLLFGRLIPYIGTG